MTSRNISVAVGLSILGGMLVAGQAMSQAPAAGATPAAGAAAGAPAAAPGGRGGGRGGAGAPAAAPAGARAAAPPAPPAPPPPPPGPADYTNTVGIEFMKIPTGTMIEGAYDPCEIFAPPAAPPAPVPAPAPGGGRGAAPAAAAPAAPAPPPPVRTPCGATTAGWSAEAYVTADKLLRDATILGFKVNIAKPYYMDRYEVTQGEWKKVMGNNPSIFQGSKVTDDADRHPVENVTWEDAQAFVKKLNALEHTTAYRLPTEFEWEWASRAGQFRAPSTPGEGTARNAWTSVFTGTTKMVGQKEPNAWGLYDTLGNVWEWVQDVYNEKVQPDPVPPKTGKTHVLKGASYMSHVANVASAVHAGGPGDAFDTGFRIVKDIQ